MPKQVHEIIAFHGGINNNSDARDIKNQDLNSCQDAMVDEVGKIRTMGDALDTTNLPSNAIANIENGYGLFHSSFDWTMLSSMQILPQSGTIAAGETITGSASGATALVIKNYNNVIYFLNNSKGPWTGHGTWSGSEVSRNFTYRVIQGNTNGTATITLNASGYDVLTAVGTPAIYVSGTGIPAGAYIASVTNSTTFIMNTSATGTSSNTNITFRERITSSGGATANVNGAISYPQSTGTSAYFIQDDNKVHVFDENLSSSGSTDWFENIIDIGTDSSNVEPVFYIVDGMLRVSDGNHSNTNNSTQFFGYIPAKIRTVSGFSETAAGWFTGNSEVTGLSNNQFDDGPLDSNISTGSFGSDDGDIRMFLYEFGDTTTEWNGDWKGGLTFIYDDGQESNLSIGPDTLTLNASKKTAIGITINLQSPNAGGLIPERVKKIGVYLQDTGSSEWWFQGEVDLELGGLLNGFDIRQGWLQIGTTTGTSNAHKYTWLRDNRTNQYNARPILISTYKDRTGREVGENTTATFKSAIVANRQVYVSNVQQDGEVSGDKIIKTPVNKFDTFLSDRSIEATINDGDEIIAIQSYADRILEYKKAKMTIINISQEIEFLEETFPFKGISNPSAVCRTDYGVAWINKNGCFLYDGKQVIDLLDRGGLQLIKQSVWESFITDNSMIGFFPKKKQLIIVKDSSASSAGDIYLFDIITRSWVQGDSKLTDSVSYTNFVNNVLTGDLVYSSTDGTSIFYKWRDTSQSTSKFKIQTKDIDFGHPSQRKKIYKVYISYKGDGTHVQVKYGVNGDTPSSNFYKITSGTDGSSSNANANAKCIAYDAGTDDWLNAELKPASPINNVNSFMILIDADGSNAISSDFEINDISVVYRLKNIK